MMRAVALLASAKDKYIDMNRTFSVSGKAVMLLKTKVTDDHEFQDLRWTLSNQHFNSGNVPLFFFVCVGKPRAADCPKVEKLQT